MQINKLSRLISFFYPLQVFHHNNQTSQNLPQQQKMLTQPQQQQTTQSTPKLTFIQQLRKVMLQSEPKCQSTNTALYICINKLCQHPNPFICPQPECSCSVAHEMCPQIRAKSFIKVFERKDKIVDKVLEKINQRTDKLIDDISELREKTIDKLKSGQDQEVLGSYVDKAWWSQHQGSENLSLKRLNGQLMNQIWQSDQRIDSQKKHQQVLNTIEKAFDKFSNQIQIQFERIFKIVLQTNTIEKFFWSKKFRGDTQLIKGRTVMKVSGSTSDRYALLEPSLTKLNAKRVQWQIKVIKVAGWVGLGICVRSLVEKNKFDFINYSQADHGGYIISSNGYTWSHQNPPQNSNTTHGIEILTGHEIAFDLDLQTRVLKYINKVNQRTGAVNVVYPLKEGEEYHICSCLGSVGDEVELIGNVVVDGCQATVDETGE